MKDIYVDLRSVFCDALLILNGVTLAQETKGSEGKGFPSPRFYDFLGMSGQFIYLVKLKLFT